MLILKDIIKNYEVPVLGPIDVEIKSKSFVSVIGASGSGKSTFLRLASGLISQSSGSISYKNNIKPKIRYKSVLIFGFGICFSRFYLTSMEKCN